MRSGTTGASDKKQYVLRRHGKGHRRVRGQGTEVPACVEERCLRKGVHGFLRQFEQGGLYLCRTITALM
jgi:hypothetical protein